MELGREDGSGLVEHAFVAAVVEVDKVLLEVAGQGAGVDGVAVVLAGDVALAGGQVKRRDVVGTVAVLELDGAGADGESEKLVAEANAHNGDLGRLHETGEVVDSLLAVGRVTGAVGDEDAVVVLGYFVNGIVVRENGDRRAAAHQAAENVLLDTAIEQSNMELGARRLNHEGSLGADALNQVDLAGIDEALVLVGIVLVTNRDSGKGGTLLTEVGDDFAGVDARDGGDTFTGTPFAQALNSRPVAVLEGDIGDNHASDLNMGRFKVLEEVVVVALAGRNTVVSNERLGEDEDLPTVRWVGHGLGIADQRGSEDGFTGDVGIGTKSLALEDRAVLSGGELALLRAVRQQKLTRMVKVAGIEATGAVAVLARAGIFLPALPVERASVAKSRTWFKVRGRAAAAKAAGLVMGMANRANIFIH